MTCGTRPPCAEKPARPRATIRRQFGQELERLRAPRRSSRTTIRSVLLRRRRKRRVSWARLAARPFPAYVGPLDSGTVERVCPGEPARVLQAAEAVLARRVDMLGSGPIQLGRPIDWLVDFKTGRRWEPAFHRSIEYANLDEPSDVKVPWELSRLQWAIPAGQAYLLTGEERYAVAVRELLDEWIAGNPYGLTVNWACTMDVALRILSWTWFFHIFNATEDGAIPSSRPLSDGSLSPPTSPPQPRAVRCERHTADAAGLFFAGLFW